MRMVFPVLSAAAFAAVACFAETKTSAAVAVMAHDQAFAPIAADANGGVPQAYIKGLGNNLRETLRTIGFRAASDYNSLWYRSSIYTSYAGDHSPYCRGFRFCMTCE